MTPGSPYTQSISHQEKYQKMKIRRCNSGMYVTAIKTRLDFLPEVYNGSIAALIISECEAFKSFLIPLPEMRKPSIIFH